MYPRATWNHLAGEGGRSSYFGSQLLDTFSTNRGGFESACGIFHAKSRRNPRAAPARHCVLVRFEFIITSRTEMCMVYTYVYFCPNVFCPNIPFRAARASGHSCRNSIRYTPLCALFYYVQTPQKTTLGCANFFPGNDIQ